jgi:hypothetical protein
MSNLESSITRWRQQMLAAGIQTPVPLEELETHLRDEIAQRLQSGMGEQSAFESAVQQLGGANPLNKEFAKVETTADARKWKLQQLALAAHATVFPLWIGSMVFFRIGDISQTDPGERLSCLVAMAAYTFLFWSGRLSHRRLPVIASKKIRETIIGAGFGLMMLWGIVFLRLIVPHYDFTVGRFFVVLLWGFVTPMGFFGGLAWGLETAARRPHMASDS